MGAPSSEDPTARLSGPHAGQETSLSGGKALTVSGIPGVAQGAALDLPGCANRVTQVEGPRDYGPESPLLGEGIHRGRPVAGGRAGALGRWAPRPLSAPLSGLGRGPRGCAWLRAHRPRSCLPPASSPTRSGCCQRIYMEQGGHPLPVHSSRSLFEGKIDFRMIVH